MITPPDAGAQIVRLAAAIDRGRPTCQARRDQDELADAVAVRAVRSRDRGEARRTIREE